MTIDGKNNNDKWLRVDLSTPPELTDAVSNFLEEIGAEGVFQEFLVPALSETKERTPRECLTAYLPLGQKEDGIAALKNYLGDLILIFPDIVKPTFTVKEVASPDWGEEWKKYFHPFRVGKRIVIKPTWEIYTPADDDIVVEIDPGMAFGTGQHASTIMCLEAMEDIFINGAARCDVLDVGTGTGILGIVAAKLGAASVICLDIDDKAVEIACANAILNGVKKSLTIKKGEISSLRRPFNLILANLTAKPLIDLSGEMERLLAPGGFLVISGIIEQSRQEIEDCFFPSPLHFRRMIKRQEWLCYIFAKKEAP